MNTQDMKWLCAVYLTGFVVLNTDTYANRLPISTYLTLEAAWLLLIIVIVFRSRHKFAIFLLVLPMFWFVERQLIVIALMSWPYLFDKTS
jgi:hypothetical protein